MAEVPERARGRERWWRRVRADLRFPLRSEQNEQTREVLDELARISYARDLEMFARAQAESEPGGWGDAFPYSHGTIRVGLDQLTEFFEEYLALLNRYRDAEPRAGDGSRVVLTRFLAFPAPLEP